MRADIGGLSVCGTMLLQVMGEDADSNAGDAAFRTHRGDVNGYASRRPGRRARRSAASREKKRILLSCLLAEENAALRADEIVDRWRAQHGAKALTGKSRDDRTALARMARRRGRKDVMRGC